MAGLPQSMILAVSGSSLAGELFQAAVGDQGGQPFLRHAGQGFAGGDGQVDEFTRIGGEVAGQVRAAGEAFDFLAVGQLFGGTDAVHQDDAAVGVPDRGVAQDGQVGGQPGARGQQPQVATGREAFQGQEAIGRFSTYSASPGARRAMRGLNRPSGTTME